MKTNDSSEAILAQLIQVATHKAVCALFAQHPEHFYYLSLITTGEAHSPVVAAWSQEALEEAVKNEADKDEARSYLKWSYAESPYYCFGDEYFSQVRNAFSKRPNVHSLDDVARSEEVALRLRAMESALAALDSDGVFGTGSKRLALVVNVEVMPPDFTNVQRALRLNPPEALRRWLAEAAEPPADSGYYNTRHS